MKRIRIEQFFLDFDKLRKGRVTRNQFKSILSQLGFNLTNEEYDGLCDKYADNSPEKFVLYPAFIASINKAFTTTGIQKAPTTNVPQLNQGDTLLARRKYLNASKSFVDLESVMDEYRYAVLVRRIMLKPLFQDFDRTKNGHVTKQQFLRVVDSLRITAPEEITQELLRPYMDMGNVDEVNYVDFCEDIDNSKELFGVGRDFNHSYDYFPKTRPRVS